MQISRCGPKQRALLHSKRRVAKIFSLIPMNCTWPKKKVSLGNADLFSATCWHSRPWKTAPIMHRILCTRCNFAGHPFCLSFSSSSSFFLPMGHYFFAGWGCLHARPMGGKSHALEREEEGGAILILSLSLTTPGSILLVRSTQPSSLVHWRGRNPKEVKGGSQQGNEKAKEGSKEGPFLSPPWLLWFYHRYFLGGRSLYSSVSAGRPT